MFRRRVPVVLQLTTRECGAACLAMVLAYHGRRVRLAECRDRMGIGRDGATARDILEAARAYGLRGKAYTVEPAACRQLPVPAVLHWGFNHFVVLERWSARKVEIVDPAAGRRRLTPQEFDEGLTGVVLALEPGAGFETGSAEGGLWRTYLKRLLAVPGTRAVLAQILAASLLLQLLGLAFPVLTKVLVDAVLPQGLGAALGVFVWGVAIWAGALLVTHYLRTALLVYLQGRLDARMMTGFFEHLLALPYAFFEQRTSGDLLMRLSANSQIREILTSPMLSLFLDGGFVVVYLAILLSQAPAFGLLALAVGLAQVLTLALSTRRVHELMQRDLQARAEHESYAVEALHGIATVKATGGEHRALDYWSDLFHRHLAVALERQHFSGLVDVAMNTLRTLAPVVLLVYGAARVLEGAMTLGTMLAYHALAAAFLAPLAALVANSQQLQVVGAHLDRLADVLAAEPEQRAGARPAPRLKGAVELRRVSFRYSEKAPLVLRDVSVAIGPGSKVALVGRTGSGKSTLAKLLLGLYRPVAGEILYDGIPIEELDYRSLRRQFGVVLQDAYVFGGSIRRNVTLGDPDLSFDAVLRAARLADLDEEIEAFPMGYETLLAEGGGSLSGGQRQRLALARAVVHEPSILVLDEATSQLDAVTEERIDRRLDALAATRIVIAHRLSTVKNADLILVLDGGEIVERGTHASLVERGRYAELVRRQTGNEDEIPIPQDVTV